MKFHLDHDQPTSTLSQLHLDTSAPLLYTLTTASNLVPRLPSQSRNRHALLRFEDATPQHNPAYSRLTHTLFTHTPHSVTR